MWFPTTLDGEAYEWYRDHDAGHFVTWDQLLREFLTEYMPEVDQSTALRTLAVMRQGEEESITAYIRRFEVVRSRYVGVALNEETLRQFFIQGFAKPSTVRSVMKRNPVTVADAKMAAKEVEQFEKDYEKLWRREDESIPQFVPIRPMVFNVPAVGQEGQVPRLPVKPGPQLLATKAPEPMLALPAPKVDTQIEELEKRLGANQEGFQDAFMKQMQSFTDQLALVIRSQQPGPPPQVESGRHATGMWCMQCKQPGHTSQYCQNRQNQNQRNNGGNQQQNQRPQGQNQYGQGNNRGAPPRQNIQNEGKKEYHNACGRWHAQGQCWSDGQNFGCNNCGGRHATEECRQPDSSGNGMNQGMNSQQNNGGNMQGMRPQGVNTNEPVQPNIYYDQTNPAQQYQPPAGGQANNGYVPNHNGSANSTTCREWETSSSA